VAPSAKYKQKTQTDKETDRRRHPLKPLRLRGRGLIILRASWKRIYSLDITGR